MFNSLRVFLLIPLIFIVYLAFNKYNIDIREINKTPETVPVEEPKKVAKVIDHKQLLCLADNIYFEAGGEPTEGKAAVARVVLNRINHGYGNTPCQVVYQSTTVKQTNDDDETFWVKACQFAWVCEGKKNPNRQSPRYQNSLRVAQDVLLYDMYKEVIPMSVLFFHNLSVQPAITYGFVKRIGNHIFYSKPHKKRK